MCELIKRKQLHKRTRVHGWLLYSSREKNISPYYIELYQKACEKHQMSAELGICDTACIYSAAVRHQIKEQIRQDAPAYVINRTRDYRIAELFEQMKIPVFNSSKTARLGNDKALAYRYMEKRGIPVMPSDYSLYRPSRKSEPSCEAPLAQKEAAAQSDKAPSKPDEAIQQSGKTSSVLDEAIQRSDKVLLVPDEAIQQPDKVLSVPNEAIQQSDKAFLIPNESQLRPDNVSLKLNQAFGADKERRHDIYRELPWYPAVVKSCEGHGGTQVYWIQDKTAWLQWLQEHLCSGSGAVAAETGPGLQQQISDNIVRQTDRTKTGVPEISRTEADTPGLCVSQAGICETNYIIQQASNEPGRDLRVYIVGNKITAAVLRTSDTDFRSNYCLGGTARLYTLSQKERELVQRAVSGLEIGMAGIDFIFHNGEPVFNEIEDTAGARALYALSDYDIVNDYIQYIRKELFHAAAGSKAENL